MVVFASLSAVFWGCVALWAVITPIGAVAVTLQDKFPYNKEPDEHYSFEEFVRDYRKAYESEEEYLHRKRVFEANLEKIREHNQAGSSNYILGVNYLADLETKELPLGYDKWFSWRNDIQGQQSSTKRRLHQFESLLTLKDVSELPLRVDWREQGITTPVKSQGGCGSCWAFASTEAMESHIAMATGTLFSLSPQELVSCVDNPLECGGNGGCMGGTAELAYGFVAKDGHGMVQEWQFGYQSYSGENVSCAVWNASATPHAIRHPVATIEGYTSLPSNDYVALMNVVAALGPVSVSVAASEWVSYKSGIFEPHNATSPAASDINHAVVLEGYGTDPLTGLDYWLVRNSWGPTWGEKGYIRLKRVDPSTLDNPNSDCAMDVTPGNGVACDKNKSGKDIKPPPAKVCGNSGILFDCTIPIGGRLL